jgi:hypothetical protein
MSTVMAVLPPTSSRKRVPRWASSKRPKRRAVAPVNDPFSWPKSSLSTTVSGSAAQLNLMKGPAALAPLYMDGACDQLLADAALA